MDHENPPMALPNGQVYSKSFIMSRAVPAAQQRKRKSRYVSTSPSSQNDAPSPVSGDTVELTVSEQQHQHLQEGRRDAIDILLNFRRARLQQRSGQEEDMGGCRVVDEPEDGSMDQGEGGGTPGGGVSAATGRSGENASNSINSLAPPKLVFTCPISQQCFDVDQIRQVYIV